MAYLTGARPRREVAATVWMMCVGAGLLATSPPEDGGDPVLPVWSSPGPSFVLNGTERTQAFAVTVFAPKVSEGSWSAAEFVQVSLSVSADHDGANGAASGAAGQAGAAPTPVGEDPPWSTVTLQDSSGTVLLESTPFLSSWGTTTDMALSGDCAAPDPAGADPCRLSFSVDFERSPSESSAQSTYSWSMSVSANGGAEPGAAWTAEIEPL